MTHPARAFRTPASVVACLASLAVAVLLLLPLTACGGDEIPPPPPPDTGADTGVATGTGAAPEGGVQPITSADGAAPSIRWQLPEGWVEEPPSSGMRMAQASIPGEAGAAEMTVFFFGVGGGGGTQANIDRWIGQMEIAEGTEAQQTEYEVNGYQVTQVEVEGTVKASGMGMGPETAQPDSRMLAAVVEGPGGPWFFKITGPNQTVLDAKDGFRQLIESLGPA